MTALRSLAWILVLALASAAPAVADDDARPAARAFGQALVSSKAELLRPILPQEGKVRLALVRLGPEDGMIGGSQVEAVFRDFLAVGEVKNFEVLRLEGGGDTATLVQGRAVLVDRDGRPARVLLHLAFQPEGGRWVLREVKETSE